MAEAVVDRTKNVLWAVVDFDLELIALQHFAVHVAQRDLHLLRANVCQQHHAEITVDLQTPRRSAAGRDLVISSADVPIG
ncbi:hypothetical protein D3C87_1699310 [compost metagenome]